MVTIKLFNESDVAIGLFSNNFYTSSKVENKTNWHQDEDNYSMIYNIIVDDELAIFKGSFLINLPFDDNFLEGRYNFTMIFTSSEKIKYHLSNNGVIFETY